ncbi:MAG TPA: hypothetical protein VIT91_14845, partial [Chthoniobacterales bacterium]
KTDGAVTQLLAAVQRKEAVLTGYLVVNTIDGVRGISETFVEKRYPTEFDPPQNSEAKGSPAPDANPVNDVPLPGTYETRAVEVTLEVEPHVSSGGDSIRVDVAPQRVELLGFDSYNATKTASGKILKVDQPRFFVSKTNATVTVQSGQHTLLAVHLLPKPENYMEVFVLRATATPIK